MNILFVIFLTFTIAYESCDNSPALPDGRIVQTPETQHNSFVTPDCAEWNLEPIADLKCLDGSFYLVKEEYKVLANIVEFCVDPALQLVENKETFDLEFLPSFWEFFKGNHEKSMVGCPAEAFECLNFDDFETLYIPGRKDEADKTFIHIPLDEPSFLEYNVYIDEYVREFSFANGLVGQLFEFFEDGMYKLYATINSEGDDHFTLYIKPCNLEETCKYVIYLQKKSFGTVGEQDHVDQFMEKDEVTRQRITETNEKVVQSRLKAHPDKRRSLSITSLVSVTFMNDPAVSSLSDALFFSASTILFFNAALAQHSSATFRLLLRTVTDVHPSSFTRYAGSCCGPDCASSAILNACQSVGNSLPDHKKADLLHCFTPSNTFQGTIVGCASANRVGVTALHRADTVSIAIHELGHQLGADHIPHCWCARRFLFWCVDTDCTLMNPSISDVIRRFHPGSITQMENYKNTRVNIAHNYYHLNEGGCYRDSQKRTNQMWSELNDKSITNNARECAERCSLNANCIGTTWLNDRSCFQAYAGAKLVSKTGVTSYTCSRLDQNCFKNMKYSGTVVNGNAGAADAAYCQSKCMNEPQCQYWDFHNSVCRLLAGGGNFFNAHGGMAGAVDCMGAEQTFTWVVSLKGRDLAPGQWVGSAPTSYANCAQKASTSKYFAWTGQVYNGYCKVLKSEVTQPNLSTNQGYGYKLFERIRGTCQWIQSSKGRDLHPHQWNGFAPTSYNACVDKAEDEGVVFFAWTASVYGGYCKVLKREVPNPNLSTYQGYNYKLYERTCA